MKQSLKHMLAKTVLAPVGVRSLLEKCCVFPEFLGWCESHAGDCPPERQNADSKEAFWQHVLESLVPDAPLQYWEFGVHAGTSIGWWSGRHEHPESVFVGFDSFEGLPEDWLPSRPRGFFSTDGRTPAIDDDRVRFIKGWFHESLPSEAGK